MAAAVAEHDARLLLVDGSGRLLGDCDGNRLFGAEERAIGYDALPRELRDVALATGEATRAEPLRVRLAARSEPLGVALVRRPAELCR